MFLNKQITIFVFQAYFLNLYLHSFIMTCLHGAILILSYWCVIHSLIAINMLIGVATPWEVCTRHIQVVHTRDTIVTYHKPR